MASNNISKAQEKKLKSHVIDEVVYTKAQVRMSWAGLIVGLWGFFFTTVVILFLMTRGVQVFG